MESFLHIGFPKCASSFLQKHYFTEAHGFNNLTSDRDWRRFLQRDLFRSNGVFYAEIKTPFLNEKRGLVGVSSEQFLDNQLGVSFEEALKRWTDIFPTPLVLMIIRNQWDLFVSQYVQYVRAGYRAGLHQFLQEMIWNHRNNWFGLADFYKTYSFLHQNVSDNVLVLPVEMLRADFEGFISSLDRFFGRQDSGGLENAVVNARYTNFQHSVWMMFNRLVPHGLGRPCLSIQPKYCVGDIGEETGVDRDSWFRSKTTTTRYRIEKLSRRASALLGSQPISFEREYQEYAGLFEYYFAESNKRLAQTINLELEKYNYVGLEPDESGSK